MKPRKLKWALGLLATGRDLVIAGPIDGKILPSPAITLEDLGEGISKGLKSLFGN